MYKQLTKSSDCMLAGVCGGIADFFEIDPTLVRVGYVILTIFSIAFPGILLYILLCIIMPKSDAE
jgi:phage shock protein C